MTAKDKEAYDRLFENLVRSMEDPAERDRVIRLIEAHPNYQTIRRYARKTKKDLEGIENSEAKSTMMFTLDLMEKPPKTMTSRELGWLLHFTLTFPIDGESL